MSRSSRWVVSELPSSEDLDPYPVTDAPPPTPSTVKSRICYDNAMAESFFAALKNERVHRTQYPTREHARRDLVRYIEFRYNTRRLHSALGYRTPQEVHNEYLDRNAAA